MSEAKLFAFDENEHEVSFNARPNAENPTIVHHRLRKPTLAELIEREQQINYELVEVNSREEQINADEDVANARLWDKIVLAVKGYRGINEWHEPTLEEKAGMRAGHKFTAIRALYASTCTVEGDDDGVSIGAELWTVRQEIGPNDAPDYVVLHQLREPTEAERIKFKRTSSATSYVKGSKKSQVRVRTNLKAYVELYDALIEFVSGATVAGHEFGGSIQKPSFLSAIDPIWKRQVIQSLMNNLEAQLSD